MSSATLRTLIYVPIIHSESDMGSLGHRLPANQDYLRLAQAGWREIETRVRALNLDWRTVSIYQDGLPDAEQEIIQKILAEVKSPNYDLLRSLVDQGATLIGTESVALIREEYDFLRTVLAVEDPAAKVRARRSYAQRAPALLVERDTYIARRIGQTLPHGGVGLLFIGQAHQVARYLSPDIVVMELTGRHGEMSHLQ